MDLNQRVAGAFAKLMREARERAGMDLETLSRLTAIGECTLSIYSNGHRAPKLDNAVAIAQILGFTLNDFWNELFEPPRIKETILDFNPVAEHSVYLPGGVET